jgi:hypothetical protein
MKAAAQIIHDLLENPDISDSGHVANDLLRSFHRGFEVANLVPLLQHPNVKVVKVAAFIVSELGNRAAPLIMEVGKLLKHPIMSVRFDAIDCMLSNATVKDADKIVSVLTLLQDNEGAIRRKVMDFLARVSEAYLSAALKFLEIHDRGSLHVVGLKGLVDTCKWSQAGLEKLVESDNDVLRKYGVVAAVRMEVASDELLQSFASANDDDVSRFANGVLELRRTGLL